MSLDSSVQNLRDAILNLETTLEYKVHEISLMLHDKTQKLSDDVSQIRETSHENLANKELVPISSEEEPYKEDRCNLKENFDKIENTTFGTNITNLKKQREQLLHEVQTLQVRRSEYEGFKNDLVKEVDEAILELKSILHDVG
jgi:ACT domain-containing protein